MERVSIYHSDNIFLYHIHSTFVKVIKANYFTSVHSPTHNITLS